MSSSSSVKTVDRLVNILDCFSPQRPAWSLAELSCHLDLPKSTLHRFLVSLEFHGVLRRDAGDMRWRLGYRLFVWGNLATESTSLYHVAEPVMHELVEAGGESAILTIYERHEVVCVGKVETRHPVRMTLQVGSRRFAHAGASSKILMAYLSPDEVQAIIDEKGLPKLCSNTITDPQALEAELAHIRAQGYAESYEETDRDAWGVATPVYNRAEKVVAAIGVAGPISRYTHELGQHNLELCRCAAQRISSLLGARERLRSD